MDDETCDGCASVGECRVATTSIETWDEGDGWVTYQYCERCAAGLNDECDRCGDSALEGYGLCQDCIDDYNAGESYGAYGG